MNFMIAADCRPISGTGAEAEGGTPKISLESPFGASGAKSSAARAVMLISLSHTDHGLNRSKRG